MIASIEGGAELLDVIEPLWEKLNQHHKDHSPHAANRFASFTFARRRQILLERAAAGGELLVLRMRDTGADRDVAYCISSVTADKMGEIESIYVEPAYRGRGFGRSLMERSLAWLEGRGATTKKLVVAVGNEQTLGFYERFGFRPVSIKLRQC